MVNQPEVTMKSKLSGEEIRKFQESILSWYEQNARVLPWRKTSNPYHVWISEVMLQQTQVNTVLPYYDKFVKTYPSIQDFAFDSEDKVLKMWEGLGYYSRVRNFQAGCRQVIEQFGGEVPRDKKQLLSIKGVGDYTSGALLSICYNIPTPAVDGNVFRIYGRLFEVEDDISKAKTKAVYETLVNETMSQSNAREFNQALMDLGATVCLYKNPKCTECPVNQFCSAYKNNTIEKFPVKLGKTKVKDVHLLTVVLKTDTNKYLIKKRPSSGLLSNFYMFLSFESETPFRNQPKFLEENIPFKVNLKNECLGNVKHVFSHLKWNLDVYSGTVKEKTIPKDKTYSVITETQMKKYAFPVPYQKVWKMYLKSKGLKK
uniref:Adenine DNA glycosylase n=1 Tax=Cacopsylla melanoneura TaxID=428564 RepID=A0A8D9BFR5_9HEMI